MKKSIKKFLIFSQVLGWSALVASACADDQNKTISQNTSDSNSDKSSSKVDNSGPSQDPTIKHANETGSSSNQGEQTSKSNQDKSPVSDSEASTMNQEDKNKPKVMDQNAKGEMAPNSEHGNSVSNSQTNDGSSENMGGTTSGGVDQPGKEPEKAKTADGTSENGPSGEATPSVTTHEGGHESASIPS